jgi:KilA-N domain
MHSISTKEIKMCSIASTSKFASVEKRNSKCLRCDHDFKVPFNLYNHLWNNKTDCNKESKISIEKAKEYANPPDFYKCQFCKEIIIDKTKRDDHELKCDKKDIIDTFSVNNIDPLISYLFAFDDNGTVITNVDKESGYINATLMCKSAKRELKEYFKNDFTKNLIKELEKCKNKLIKNSSGYIASSNIDSTQSFVFQKPSILNAKVNHTYVQEMIAIDLAGWCNVKYKIIVYNHIINYNKGLIKTNNSQKAKQNIEDINNEIIKINITSSKNYTNKHSPQFYMRKLINKPSEVELYDSSGNRIIDDEYNIFKGGSQGDHTGRQGSHISQLKGSIHLDSIECFNYTKLEEYVKDIAREMNILCAIQNSGKELNGTEYYIFKTQEEYDDFINKISDKATELNKDILEDNELEMEKEKTKQEEERTKQEKEKTRQLELQVELKRLESKKEPFVIIQENYDKKLLTREEPPKIENTENVIKIEKDVSTSQKTNYDVKTYKKKEFIYHGVHKARTGKYEACICKNKKYFYLGAYADPKVAAYAYNCKALELHGKDYNKFNNIEPPENLIWNSEINKLTNI